MAIEALFITERCAQLRSASEDDSAELRRVNLFRALKLSAIKEELLEPLYHFDETRWYDEVSERLVKRVTLLMNTALKDHLKVDALATLRVAKDEVRYTEPHPRQIDNLRGASRSPLALMTLELVEERLDLLWQLYLPTLVLSRCRSRVCVIEVEPELLPLLSPAHLSAEPPAIADPQRREHKRELKAIFSRGAKEVMRAADAELILGLLTPFTALRCR